VLSRAKTASLVVALLFAVAPVISEASMARAASNPAVVWTTVVDQHGSSVSVPYSILKRMPDADGLDFKTRDGKVSIRVWTTTESRPDFPGHNPKTDMDIKKTNCDSWPPKYYKVSKEVASYSCILRGKVSYYVATYSRSGVVALFVTYPIDLRKPWDQYVSRMARSMRQVERREIR
jgi:hypothetical protein